MRRTFAIIGVLMAASLACSFDSLIRSDQTEPQSNEVQSTESPVPSKESPVPSPIPSTVEVQTLVDGNNAFALDMYQSLRSQDSNLIFSPYSISLALAMTYAGARSETESQMAQTLHIDLPQGQLHPAFNTLGLILTQSGEAPSQYGQPLQLNIADAIWAEQTYSFLPEFLDTLAVNYGAGIHLADFINQFEPARKEINSWVSDQTQDKINDLLGEEALNADTRMVLVNAIYFKADWFYQFNPNSTQDASFHLLDGTTVNTPMMNQEIFIPYSSGNGYQAIELAYAGNTAAMDIIVPDAGDFESFESMLDAEIVNDIITSMQPVSVAFALPKFEFSSDFNLSDQLANLGMPDAFDPDKADFSGMTGGRDLLISNVLHKAFVAVGEVGTEAAAATSESMGATAMMVDVNLSVDRPFIFIIRDLESGQILFVGRVMNPTQ
jgi:serpin B